MLEDEEGFLDGPDIDPGTVDDGQVAEEMPLDEHQFDESSELVEVPEDTNPLAQTNPRSAPINPPRSEHFPVDPQLPAPDAEGTEQAPEVEQPDISQGGYDPGVSGRHSYDDLNPRDVPNPGRESIEPEAPNPGESSSTNPEESSEYSPAATASTAFTELWQKAQTEIADNKFADALVTATTAHTNQLDDQQRDQLKDLLDPLAAKVIYSREHLLEPMYTARGDETLMEIAATYQVPWQLLQNINGIENPDVLLAGTTLKVVKGPFRAEVDSRRGELTLYLQEMYAGTFVITVGNEPAPRAGTYWVKTKEEGHAYLMSDNRTIEPSDPMNPYGDVWIDLGRDNVCIHGSALKGVSAPGAGCISLSPREAHDVFGILVEGSKVEILP